MTSIDMKFEASKIVSDAEEKAAIDPESVLVARFLEAYREIREACPRGDIHIKVMVKGKVTKS